MASICPHVRSPEAQTLHSACLYIFMNILQKNEFYAEFSLTQPTDHHYT